MIDEMLAKLDELKKWPSNWDSHDALPVYHSAIAHAKAWITIAHTATIQADLEWSSPNVTADGSGAVMLEWWHNPRKITVYVEAETVDYVQVYGPGVGDKITDGEIKNVEDWLMLYRWLVEGDND